MDDITKQRFQYIYLFVCLLKFAENGGVSIPFFWSSSGLSFLCIARDSSTGIQDEKQSFDSTLSVGSLGMLAWGHYHSAKLQGNQTLTDSLTWLQTFFFFL